MARTLALLLSKREDIMIYPCTVVSACDARAIQLMIGHLSLKLTDAVVLGI